MSKQFSYEKIKAACELLGLPEKATMDMIKKHYRDLCRQWHPDLNQQSDINYNTKMSEITEAYKLIMDYCHQYQYSFTKDEFDKNVETKDWWMKRFGNDPIWGPGYKKED